MSLEEALLMQSEDWYSIAAVPNIIWKCFNIGFINSRQVWSRLWAEALCWVLDLSRAFDEVPRAGLFRALHNLGIDHCLIQFLEKVYSHTKFEFEFQGEYRSFLASKGIRQGCSAAPTLWALYTLETPDYFRANSHQRMDSSMSDSLRRRHLCTCWVLEPTWNCTHTSKS